MIPASATAVAVPRTASKRGATKPQRESAAKRPSSKTGTKKTSKQQVKGADRLLPTALGGLVWAGALCAAVATSPLAAAAVVTPVALVAGVSSARAVSRQRRIRRPVVMAAATAILLAISLPAAALAGLAAAAGAAVVAAFVAAAVSFYLIPTLRPRALMFALLGPALAGASVVVAAGQGWNFALTLVATVCAYDFACWVNGTRRGAGGLRGIAAGLITVAAAALFVAAVFVPPFSGWRPWAMLGLVGLLCAGGVVLACRVAASDRLPALRRIDSLVLAGPVWVVSVSLLLHH